MYSDGQLKKLSVIIPYNRIIERKFNVKDWILLSAVILVGCLVLLSMYMVDRQWRMMGSMQSTIASQADDLRALRTTVQSVERQIDEGVAVAATGQSSGDGGSDNAANAFRRAKQARQQEGFAEGDWYSTKPGYPWLGWVVGRVVDCQ